MRYSNFPATQEVSNRFLIFQLMSFLEKEKAAKQTIYPERRLLVHVSSITDEPRVALHRASL